MIKKMYTTSATAAGGREGHVKSINGELEVDVRGPGTPGNYLNPEIMFAGGYSACFDNAIIGTLRINKIKDVSHETTVEVTLGEIQKQQYGFEITISVAFKGLDMEKAKEIIDQAHQMCPYSNAIKNNVKVDLKVEELR
ncbi:Ohr family peroxiredoxin [Zunongwangia sp. SCSIO 43204]|uniref:Ohr family peroxiredoxin n=1 Tax=Zunongwangia sp. SCSIO 43204 TaxID=2779359 RepID=UPI001CA84507|nr:Ohr family peroxiredoxin [Zunongwangia sp. SCSIO 43204]UAB83136.1 Ohr family peroxiredoxin [Zunongwangia sp. SCSIO 43204]